jgi:hypothetical protein
MPRARSSLIARSSSPAVDPIRSSLASVTQHMTKCTRDAGQSVGVLSAELVVSRREIAAVGVSRMHPLNLSHLGMWMWMGMRQVGQACPCHLHNLAGILVLDVSRLSLAGYVGQRPSSMTRRRRGGRRRHAASSCLAYGALPRRGVPHCRRIRGRRCGRRICGGRRWVLSRRHITVAASIS